MTKLRKKLFICVASVIIFLLLKNIDFRPNNLPLLINPKVVTPVSVFYPLKIFREFMQSRFVFGDEDLSFWYLTLAEKRIIEAERLRNHNLSSSANQAIATANEYQKLGNSHLKKLIDVIDVNLLKEMSQKNQERINNFKN